MIVVNHSVPLNHIQQFEMTEEVNGTFIVSFTTFNFANNPGYELLEEESIITVDGFDFRVKQLRESKNNKSVTATSTYFELVGHRQESIYGGTRTFNDFASFVFSGTGWTYTSDVTGHALIANFGEDNVLKLIQALCATFECEYKILPGNHVHFAKQIGSDFDVQYRYGHNVKVLSKSVDTTNLRTQITGYGGNGLKVTYTSPHAEKYGIIKADPINDEQFTVSADLVEHIKKDLQDHPLVSFELDSVELINRELGEQVWLIYEPMNIEFQTRILSKKSVIRNGKLVTASVVLGNALPQTTSDLLAQQKIDIDENNKKTRSRFEQTNDRITLAVERFDGGMIEAYAKIDITADEIRSEVAASNIVLEDAIADSRSLISQTATQIRSEVSTTTTRLDGRIDTANSSITQLAGQVSLKAESSTVNALGSRMHSAEISINGLNGTITSKVSYSDYTGANIVSMINQTPYYIEINASKINLVGAVSVLSDISGSLGTITSGNINIYNEIRVGNGVHMRGSGRTGVYFDDGSQIFSGGGTMQIEAWNAVDIVARPARFYGSVDFSNASVTGLGSGSATTVRYSSASKRLYVDLYGVQQGYISVL